MSDGPNPRTTTALEQIAQALTDQASAMTRSNAIMAQWVKLHEVEYARRVELDAAEAERRTRRDAADEALRWRELELEFARLENRIRPADAPKDDL